MIVLAVVLVAGLWAWYFHDRARLYRTLRELPDREGPASSHDRGDRQL